MCGRFTLTAELGRVADAFAAEITPALEGFRPRYNIAPTDDVPVVIAAPGGRRAGPMRWGLVPHWADSPRTGARLINARSETVATRSAFRDSFLARRCLVPADGFYEWEARATGKQPYWIHRPDRALFAMAGIWASWSGGNGGGRLVTFSILTREAPGGWRWLHDRVPHILPEHQWTDWLARGTVEESLRAIVAGADPPELRLHPVSRAVNRAGYEDPDCVAEVVVGTDAGPVDGTWDQSAPPK